MRLNIPREVKALRLGLYNILVNYSRKTKQSKFHLYFCTIVFIYLCLHFIIYYTDAISCKNQSFQNHDSFPNIAAKVILTFLNHLKTKHSNCFSFFFLFNHAPLLQTNIWEQVEKLVSVLGLHDIEKMTIFCFSAI